ncbi:MAG: hypothetical protein ABIH37_05685 [archaeon]
MNPKCAKTEIQKEIQEFFSNIKNKTPKEIKKIKRLAMSKNIYLKDLRKKFCKKCLNPYVNPKTRIKNKTKSITCKNCGFISRWKI